MLKNEGEKQKRNVCGLYKLKLIHKWMETKKWSIMNTPHFCVKANIITTLFCMKCMHLSTEEKYTILSNVKATITQEFWVPKKWTSKLSAKSNSLSRRIRCKVKRFIQWRFLRWIFFLKILGRRDKWWENTYFTYATMLLEADNQTWSNNNQKLSDNTKITIQNSIQTIEHTLLYHSTLWNSIHFASIWFTINS